MKLSPLVCACLFLAAFFPGRLSAQDKPNIVLLYIDDWAWNGTPVAMNDAMENSRMPIVEMPNVERLAREGMKFGNAYGSPQCSPARVCVQTGQSSPRNGFTVFLGSKEEYYDTRRQYAKMPLIPNISDMTIDADAVTIPEALAEFGYVSAHIGKWHMRGDPGDEGYVLHDGDTSNNPGNTLRANLKPGEKKPKRLPADFSDPKLMFSVTEKAIGFIEEQAKAGRPFYCQISHYAMHAGSECLPATRDKYARHPLVQAWYEAHNKSAEAVNIGDDPAVWFGMAEDLDGRIGAVLDALAELGIEDNTYVVLVADNGYRHEELLVTPGMTQPLHARKWWLWDGGIRVPMIVRGPGIKPGSTFRPNVVNYDLLPTFYTWAGGDADQLENIDGVSLARYMAGQEADDAFRNRNLFFHYPHYRSTVPHSAMISGKHKILYFYAQPDIPLLFDLSEDLGEVSNIARERPELHKQLRGEMMSYLKTVGARFPKVNPDYDPQFHQSLKDYETHVRWGPFEGKRELDEDEK